MTAQAQAMNSTAQARRGRGFMFWLGRIALALLALVVLGIIYESLAEAVDARAYPPPGKLVDVGGYRLHIYCTGSGSPTVVVDTGLGDWSTAWSSVQRGVAQTTTICTYDRAGSGWSDAGPLPRDAARFASELHTLLRNAQVPGPYVIVGHSLGGLTVRLFAHEYPSDVAGIVLIESMSPRQFTSVPAAGQPPAYAQVGPSSYVQVALARLGLARLLIRPLGLVPNLPADLQAPYVSRLARPSNLMATTYETQGLPASGAEVAAVTSFGATPLIVLTGRLNTMQPNWQAWQTELVQLSTHSQHVYAEHSGHTVELDEPDAAVAAIVQMVTQVRSTAGR